MKTPRDLFTRIGPILTVSLRFDRSGRSAGTAFVVYKDEHDARQAIREFDGANANGQPIRLTLVSSGLDAAPAPVRNPFDTAVRPGKSLFDRIEDPRNSGRNRSRSPDAPRRTNTLKPPPDGVDRYVPGSGRSRSRSPARGRRGVRRDDRGRDDSRRNGGAERVTNGARPKKTQEQLDKEMEEYWGSKDDGKGALGKEAGGQAEASSGFGRLGMDDGDIDMVE
ncbi:hypothetical protein MMC09_006268 [Bachmanniomyces sp. S44760]|nr:hypothetical protein [Bachmanniomyces sp. S44760]